MSLIASISGIRGTIGGKVGDNLTPQDIVNFAASYGKFLSTQNKGNKIVIGRDARPSGKIVFALVSSTLNSMGYDVIDLGLTTTPTVEMAVPLEQAAGGIILTASHNPVNWNALKLLNHKGEFLSGAEGAIIIDFYKKGEFEYKPVEEQGNVVFKEEYQKIHVDKILELPYINLNAIKNADFKIAVDGVCSSGSIYVPYLLKRLGVEMVEKIHCETHGWFPHNPEPLKENLGDICNLVKINKLDLGIVVDPDVDRLAFVDENGEMFGEEYTLVACADYLLKFKKGPTVSNLSSSRALKDITLAQGCEYFATAVGEVNVVEKMKACNAIIGGEGNGGIILPDLHYGRDALVGIALFLSHLATSKKTTSELRKTYPAYFMAKQKIELTPEINVDLILQKLEEHYKNEDLKSFIMEIPYGRIDISTVDGVKIDFEESWAHLRKSNTEPIIRVYTEAKSEAEAEALATEIQKVVKSLI